LLKLVDAVATPLRSAKSSVPLPERVYDEVVSCDWRGKRKTSVHVLPASPAGMSKLKMLEIVAVAWPKKLVPGADAGWDASMGIIRCGNS
jgi:hypothetical protein